MHGYDRLIIITNILHAYYLMINKRLEISNNGLLSLNTWYGITASCVKNSTVLNKNGPITIKRVEYANRKSGFRKGEEFQEDTSNKMVRFSYNFILIFFQERLSVRDTQ